MLPRLSQSQNRDHSSMRQQLPSLIEVYASVAPAPSFFSGPRARRRNLKGGSCGLQTNGSAGIPRARLDSVWKLALFEVARLLDALRFDMVFVGQTLELWLGNHWVNGHSQRASGQRVQTCTFQSFQGDCRSAFRYGFCGSNAQPQKNQ